MTRNGLALDKKANKYEIQPELLQTFHGLNSLQASMPLRMIDLNVDRSYLLGSKSKLNRREKSHRNILEHCSSKILLRDDRHDSKASFEAAAVETKAKAHRARMMWDVDCPSRFE